MKKISFRTQLIIMIAVSIFTTLVSSGILSSINLSKKTKVEQETVMDTLIESCDLAIQNYIQTYVNGVMLLASNPMLVTADEDSNLPNSERKRSLDTLENFSRKYDKFSVVYFGSEEKMKNTVYPSMDLDVNPTERPWYKAAKSKNDATISPAYKDTITGKTVITIAAPVYSEGKFRGVVGGDMSLEELSRFVKVTTLGKNETVLLVNDDTKMVIASNNDEHIGESIQQELVQFLNSKSDSKERLLVNGDKFYMLTKRNKDLGATLFFLIPIKEMNSVVYQQIFLNIVISTIVFLFIVLSTFIAMKPILNHISGLTEGLGKMRGNIFTHELETDREDEFGQMVKSYNEVCKSLRETLKETRDSVASVRLSSDNLANSASNIRQASEEVTIKTDVIADGAYNQQTSLNEAVFTTDKLVELFESLQKSSDKVSDVYSQAVEINKVGAEAITDLHESTVSNYEANQRIIESIEKLTNNTKNIATILDSITDISTQTNLLALNASIEAARAGDAGRGFAVVADEIRKLANQSEESVQRISTIIREAEQESDSTVKVANESKAVYEKSKESVEQVFEAFKKVSGMIDSVSNEIQSNYEIVTNLNSIKTNLAEGLYQVKDIASETDRSSEELRALTEELTANLQDVDSQSEDIAQRIRDIEREVDKFIV